MYQQINVHPQDRNLQRILWRYSSDEPIQEYKLTTVTYGTSSAPYLSTRCLKKLADDNKCQYPTSAQVLSNDFYVDDLLSSTSNLQDAIRLQQELSTLLQTAGFTLMKWASNHTFLKTFQRMCKKHSQPYHWIMTMELQHSVCSGTPQLTNFRSRTTSIRCHSPTPQSIQNVRCLPLRHPYSILSGCLVQLSLLSKSFYRNFGKINYNGMNYFHLIWNKNGISCIKPFLSCHSTT